MSAPVSMRALKGGSAFARSSSTFLTDHARSSTCIDTTVGDVSVSCAARHRTSANTGQRQTSTQGWLSSFAVPKNTSSNHISGANRAEKVVARVWFWDVIPGKCTMMLPSSPSSKRQRPNSTGRRSDGVPARRRLSTTHATRPKQALI
eukprot:3544554-Rhodomonas_salina.1